MIEMCCLKNVVIFIQTIFNFNNEEVKRVGKNGEEITKSYLTNYNLLVAHDLWQAYYEMLLVILLEE